MRCAQRGATAAAALVRRRPAAGGGATRRLAPSSPLLAPVAFAAPSPSSLASLQRRGIFSASSLVAAASGAARRKPSPSGQAKKPTAKPTQPLGAKSLVERYEARVAKGSCRKHTAQVECLERLEGVLAELHAAAGGRGRVPRGVYIYGDPGAGKTMLLDLFHEAVQEAGLPSRRAHFHDFMLDMNRELHKIRKAVGGMQDPLALVAKGFVERSPLLCFDECHVLNVGDALLMRSFFERLFDAGGTVVVTSNLAPDELYSSGINREVFQPFIDALTAHCDPVRLTVGEDFRSSRSAALAAESGERTFFWPPGPDSDLRLRAALATVLGCEGELPPPTSGNIPVPMGRSLPCRRMWRDSPLRAAEFSYEELCVRPVGTYDYIALCENFDAIVITDIPRFGASDENAARRFAALVDILYDRHKRLLCTIEAPPKELFQAIREQYSGGADDIVDDNDSAPSVRMPTFGGSSGRHVAQFRLPSAQSVAYTEHGGYSVSGDVQSDARPEQPQDMPDGGWVEWSATGLKDASMFDLTCSTKAQQHDRLLPILRCESRLEEMSYLHGQDIEAPIGAPSPVQPPPNVMPGPSVAAAVAP